jgi:hypothetical protein
MMMAEQPWRPIAEFDPSKPAIVHDKLNDKTIDWRPERYLDHYRANSTPFDPGVIEWDGLLLDGWKDHNASPAETG